MEKVKFFGEVIGKFVTPEETVLNVRIEPGTEDMLTATMLDSGMEWDDGHSCIKHSDEYGTYVKCKTRFSYKIKGADITPEELGKGTTGMIYINLNSGKYQRKSYVSAYLVGIDVMKAVKVQKYNPFEDEDFK